MDLLVIEVSLFFSFKFFLSSFVFFDAPRSVSQKPFLVFPTRRSFLFFSSGGKVPHSRMSDNRSGTGTGGGGGGAGGAFRG